MDGGLVRRGAIWLLLAVLAAGCTHPRAGSVVSVRTADSTGESHAAFARRVGSGYVLRDGGVLTVDHAAPSVGESVAILTCWQTIPATVVRRWQGWALVRPTEHTRPGDSGAPVVCEHGAWVGSVEGWVRR